MSANRHGLCVSAADSRDPSRDRSGAVHRKRHLWLSDNVADGALCLLVQVNERCDLMESTGQTLFLTPCRDPTTPEAPSSQVSRRSGRCRDGSACRFPRELIGSAVLTVRMGCCDAVPIRWLLTISTGSNSGRLESTRLKIATTTVATLRHRLQMLRSVTGHVAGRRQWVRSSFWCFHISSLRSTQVCRTGSTQWP